MSGIKFYIDCPYCKRRLRAWTRTVVEHIAREHMTKCFAQARARTVKQLNQLAAHAQLPLFGGDS